MFELQVDGMSCNHCISRVTKAVRSVDAGAKVDIDLTAKQVRVISSAELEEIAAAIAEAGYPVENGKIA